MDLIAGILRQEIERAGFAAAGFDAGDGAAGDGLADPEIAGPDSVDAMHAAKVNGCAACKGDVQKNSLRALHVGVLLQNPNRPAGKPGHPVAGFQFLNEPRPGGSIDERVFRNAGECQLESGQRREE